jgi:hypothetical protein
MKLAFLLLVFTAAILPQTGTSPLHVPGVGGNANLTMTADSIVREDPSNAVAVSPYASDVQLKGHVEIRMCCVQRPASKGNPTPATAYLILHADEADYHGGTGEFEARGTVKVNFQNVQIQNKK